jgi:predicted RNA-binding protein YlqC (UPF0109 family)
LLIRNRLKNFLDSLRGRQLDGKTTTSSSVDGGEGKVREMLLYTVRSLVNHPDEVEVILVSYPEGALFRIHTHPEDLSELIGNGGQTGRALQTILGASGMKLGRRMTLDIVQHEGRPQ